MPGASQLFNEAARLANVRHTKRQPGHETNVTDAEWRADLLRQGTISLGFRRSP